jgi:tetratricopeptide (TPR) repeat protein
MLLKRIRANVIALALTPSFLLCTTQSEGQADMKPPVTPERIASELTVIESAAARHATADELGTLWAQLASDYHDELDIPRAEEAYDHALKLLRGSVMERHNYAVALDGLGALYLLKRQFSDSAICRRKALAIFEAEGDRKNVLALHGNLALSMLREGTYSEAEKEASEAIEGMAGQASANDTQLATVFITRSYARCFQHRCKDGLSDAQQAVDIDRAYLRTNPLEAAASWTALGYMEWKTGDVAGADENMRRAFQILSEKSNLPYTGLLWARIEAMMQYQQFLNETHRKAEARQVGAEMARLAREQRSVCGNCSVNVEALSNALR